jgi:hypothetical protein
VPAIPSKHILEIDVLGRKQTVALSADGTIPEPLILANATGTIAFVLEKGTRVIDTAGNPLDRLELKLADLSAEGLNIKSLPNDVALLSPVYRLTGYRHGAETPLLFVPPAIITLEYDGHNLAENIDMPFIAYLEQDEGLVPLEPPEGSMFEIGKARAGLSHASLLAVAARLLPDPPPLPALFKVRGLEIVPGQIEPGQAVTISLVVINEGETEGSHELYLQVDGIVRMVKKVTVAAQGSEKVTFELSGLVEGTHQVEVAGLRGMVEVVSVPSTVHSSVDWLFFNLGVGAMVLIGLVLLYYVKRRSRPQKL